jgi:hypothetical protein
LVWSLNSLTLPRRWTVRKAAEVGAAGVIMSNHGGRQLDYALPTISALEAVAQRDRSVGRPPAAFVL